MSAVLREERSLGELFSELAGETRTLVRQEIALAKTEVTEKVSFLGKNLTYVAIGGVVLLLGALPILAGIVIALGHQIGYAPSAFIVGIVITAAGAFLVMKALGAMKKTPLAPEQTKAQVKETTQWMKEQVR